ncbi:MAG: YbaN family protein [Bacteroidales bacterium]|nr:YbaN family protein [Bacteroidales bacterium]
MVDLLIEGNNFMNLFKLILVSFGTISLGLGIIGVIVPGLPTTPFLLLSAGLYLRSSEKLYRRLLSTKWIGPYIIKYQTNKGLTKRDKIFAIVTMWLMIALSGFIFITSLPVRTGLIVAGLIGTYVMGFIIPTVPISNDKDN